MYRPNVPLPLVASTLVLMVLMGGAQAALFRMAQGEPGSEAEGTVIQIAEVKDMLNEGHELEALRALETKPVEPLYLPASMPSIEGYSPAGVALNLALSMETAARRAVAEGRPNEAKTYVARCYTLSQQIQSAKGQTFLGMRTAQTIAKIARRTELAILSE